ncbi:MarR family winged helix-turn-helix transcriptional regulator [Lacticaseibacillus daqingensis]|uniref:MarR family winged helix-turn-helix transcriptional regulator n=1 Tax=Lacticaseibacillus daqingensis TaxID=2486014 RepID=UPI000F7B421C|nr:MarR family transcriptional regulator [Lacticaseibacillus daqingensis]
MTTGANDIDFLKDLPALSRRYVQILDQTLARYDLSGSLYYYLIKLHEFGDLPQERLVQLTGVNASNVTRAVQRLTGLGYLTKKANPKDRRGFVLSLTPQGTTLYPVVLECLQTAQAQFLAPLTAAERQQFQLILQRLAQ